MPLRRGPLHLAALLAVAGCASQQSTAGTEPASARGAHRSIAGAWRVVDQATRAPGEAWVSAGTPYRSLYLFTDSHYSYSFTRPEPRPPFTGDPNRPSDAEKVRAYDTFVAATGRYELVGSTLTLVAAVHKNPSEMTGEPLHYAAELRSDTLTLSIANAPFQPGRERRTVLVRIR